MSKWQTRDKMIAELQAANGQLREAAKELIAAFPNEIPADSETVEFAIPAYLVENLCNALNWKGGEKK